MEAKRTRPKKEKNPIVESCESDGALSIRSRLSALPREGCEFVPCV